MVCKMHTPVYLFDGFSNEFKHHHFLSKNHTFEHCKAGKLHFLLMSLKFISLQKNFFSEQRISFLLLWWMSKWHD